MLHFIQKISQVSSKMLKPSFTVSLKTSKGINAFTRKTCLQQNFSSLFPRPWLFSSFPVCVSPTQHYYTSPPSIKKKQKEALVPSKTPNIITYLPDSPKPALYITLGGLIPFVMPPLIMVMTESYIPLLASAQITYGASFLSFLGGISWGFALSQDSPAKPNYLNLANSAVPLMFSWYAFLISERLSEAIVTVMIGLGITLQIEFSLLPHYPNWFKALRIMVTLIAFFSFLVTLVVNYHYPEKGPKRTGQAE